MLLHLAVACLYLSVLVQQQLDFILRPALADEKRQRGFGVGCIEIDCRGFVGGGWTRASSLRICVSHSNPPMGQVAQRQDSEWVDRLAIVPTLLAIIASANLKMHMRDRKSVV